MDLVIWEKQGMRQEIYSEIETWQGFTVWTRSFYESKLNTELWINKLLAPVCHKHTEDILGIHYFKISTF